ncbi:exopolysaccharide Pel transporter PelG [Bhargavaea ullalensis]|uniref:Membrane protein n=1 Tax=Bhargavaea ullalensis TaxID=1265685 RepID=A0ABV2GEG8_9BACL
MAGIGFQLQKMFKDDHFSSNAKAYGYTAMVTAGPWLVVLATLLIIQRILPFSKTADFDGRLVVASISYCFIFSQIIFGALQLIVTRYVSDRLYERDTKSLFSVFLGALIVQGAAALLLWLVFCLWSVLPGMYNLLLLFLFMSLLIIWTQSVFLTAAKQYMTIVRAFVTGGATAVLLTILLSITTIPDRPFLYEGLVVLAFLAGMMVTALFLSRMLIGMFPEWGTRDLFKFLSYIDVFPHLMWTGLLYNAGLWVCNIMIWFGAGSTLIAGTFKVHLQYDTAIFLAYLTIIPTYMFFVVSIETRFYEKYKRYYGLINNGGSLGAIEQAMKDMQGTLAGEIKRLIRNQSIVTFAAILLTVLLFFNYGHDSDFLFMRLFGYVGAFSNALLLVNILLMLYFEDRKGAFRSAVIFFIMNAVLTYILLPTGESNYGLSFATGSSIAFIYSLNRLMNLMDSIEYHVFTPTQPKGAAGFFTRWSVRLSERFNQ